MIHHLVKEQDIVEKCMYCSRAIAMDEWHIALLEKIEYMTSRCPCGHENRLRGGHCLDHELIKRFPREVMKNEIKRKGKV